jgi:hypothetical protein
MAFNQHQANHKVWDHVGNMSPNVEHSEGERPAIEFQPAAWLPVQMLDKHYENWEVIKPGKIVALDNDGKVVPAQYGLAGATITYTSTDVDAGVVDVRTGETLLLAAIGTFTVASVTAFMGRTGLAMAVSQPIGVTPYAVLQWAGGDGVNPMNFRQHNYNMQHQIAVLCDYVLELPLIPAGASSQALVFAAPVSNVAAAAAVANLPVAKNTTRTPITFTGGSAATLFVTEVADASLVTSAGDWHIDLRTGVVSVYSTGAVAGISISYFHYAAAPSTVSKFACAVGNLKPGDFVKCDANSNFAVALVSDGWAVMGQVLDVDSAFPKDALDKVRTAYLPAIGTNAAGAKPGTLGQLDQMPGSATEGYPANIHYAGGADTVVRINLISR